MAIKLTSTREEATLHGLKILVSGLAGSGKTSLCATTGGSPIIISAEAGLLSLRHVDIPVLTVSTMAEVEEAYAYLLSPEGAQYDWVCLDSISEIAEVVLTKEKAATKDPRQAYGALSDQMGELIRAFRDLPERNVYMTCKLERTKDETTGRLVYGPSFPGQRLAQQVGYWFDEVFVLRTEQDSDGILHRYLQTQSDLQYTAKDRSGALDLYESPNLADIAAKIRQPSLRAAA
jgi:hypothetical protein